jgi:hypothetical protein
MKDEISKKNVKIVKNLEENLHKCACWRFTGKLRFKH